MEREECRQPPGVMEPVVSQARCEGKADCVRVCPCGVFEVRSVPDTEKAALGAFTRFKLFVHGGKQAYVVHPEACEACGLCVTACPEKAVTLRRRAT
jgi:NAD-dependent dihydropyrimidine dehydrogenase PreA subunit